MSEELNYYLSIYFEIVIIPLINMKKKQQTNILLVFRQIALNVAFYTIFLFKCFCFFFLIFYFLLEMLVWDFLFQFLFLCHCFTASYLPAGFRVGSTCGSAVTCTVGQGITVGSRALFFAWKEVQQLIYGSSSHISPEGVSIVKWV